MVNFKQKTSLFVSVLLQNQPSYGGQAVIEGVMMKAPDGKMALACRLPDASIIIEKSDKPSYQMRYPILRLPILRGVAGFVESMVSGMTMLTHSAELASQDEEGEAELSGWQTALAALLAVAMSVGLFIILPTFIMRFISFESLTGGSAIIQNLLESLVRLLIFLSYVLVVSTMKDIKRVFEYHGAEHKTIHCYEAGEELTSVNAARYSCLHPRCGTSFLLIVMVVSSLFFSLFGWPNLVQRIIYRLLLLPVVAGISYEVLRFLARFESKSSFVKLLTRPGLELQRLTTREPDLQQLEVAIAALKAILPEFQDETNE